MLMIIEICDYGAQWVYFLSFAGIGGILGFYLGFMSKNWVDRG